MQNTWITPLLDLHKKMALVQADTGHLRAYFEPELRLLWSFFAEIQFFFFFFFRSGKFYLFLGNFPPMFVTFCA